MTIHLENYRVKPGQQVHLDEINPEETGDYQNGKDKGIDEQSHLTKDLEGLQERLYAAHKNAVLVILQGMDTCGKDGTIRRVFEGVNPQGVKVATFKAPTAIELEHDYLWRVHQKLPAKGELVVFNRSHYEDVLIVRVHELVNQKVWGKRYGQINDFERMLVDEGTIILKFFLHISKHEQKQRLLDRLNQPDKHWKFDPQDLKERKLWGAYMQAYQDMLGMTSTKWAPWYIIPANKKWFRDLLVASALVDTLKQLNPQQADSFSEKEIDSYRAELEKE